MGILKNDIKSRIYVWKTASYGRRSLVIGLALVGTILVLPALDPLQAMIVLSVTVLGISYVLNLLPEIVFSNAIGDIKGILKSIGGVFTNQLWYFKGNKEQREEWTYSFINNEADRKRELADAKAETSSKDEEYF